MADYNIKLFFCFLITLFSFVITTHDILCEPGFCRSYRFDEGCADPAIQCGINNATHTGLWLPSPTLCNCCDYCMPFYGEGEHCTTGGPGTGTTVGRCGDGLTCTTAEDGEHYCTRMTDSKCHKAQDAFDAREQQGQIGALEQRPHCDGKGRFAAYECIPAHTCFCQSEEGDRLFGEVVNLGAITTRNMRCECSRLHDRMKKSIGAGVPYPVVGPRCTSDGNFYPIQCIANICYCVNVLTGVIDTEVRSIDLERTSITELACYDAETDLYPQYSEGDPPYNFTTPCLKEMQAKIDYIIESEEAGFDTSYYNDFLECLPDGTYGRITITRTGSKICTDERGQQIEDYEAAYGTDDFENMNCKCAQTANVMGSVPERPICCKNGNFREIQCRRGKCRCVDDDGRQTTQEQADVTQLKCFQANWKTC